MRSARVAAGSFVVLAALAGPLVTGWARGAMAAQMARVRAGERSAHAVCSTLAICLAVVLEAGPRLG